MIGTWSAQFKFAPLLIIRHWRPITAASIPEMTLNYMAIVNAAGGGIARNSADNKTYRMVRGRIIMTRKRDKPDASTRGINGDYKRAMFGMINMFMAAHASDIEVSFNKSKYGSQRNYFFHINNKALRLALDELAKYAAINATMPMLTEIEEAIATYATANPTAILRVRLSGFNNVYLTGQWSEDDNPVSGGATDALGTGQANTTAGEITYTAPIALSMNFRSGAKIVRPAGQITLTAASLPSGVTAADIKFLTENGTQVPNIEISEVTSVAGSLKYTTGAITAENNALAILVKGIYIRLTSAYVQKSNVDENPFG